MSPVTGAAELAVWAVLCALLAAIAWIDLRTHRIPNALNAALLLSGLAATALSPTPGLVAALGGSALGGLALLMVSLGYRHLRGRDGLGLGDVKFLVAAGAWTGWQGVGPLIFLAAMTALLWLGLRRLAGGRIDRDQPIAFGAFLSLALVAVRVLQHTGLWS